MGMASGLETICGQAYGAQQYQKFGVQTYSAIFSLTIVCLPLSLVWINMEKILVSTGQDPQIAHEAGKFIMLLLPALFAYAIMGPIVRYFQMQSLILPMLISSCVTLCLHIPLCWALVFKTGLNNIGGALAMSISLWLNVIFLGLYMRYSSACAKTRAPISMELFQGIWEFFRIAIPSAVMIWWFFPFQVVYIFIYTIINCFVFQTRGNAFHVMFILALNGGRLSCLSCCLGCCQIHNLKLQLYLFGMFATFISCFQHVMWDF